MSCSKQGLRPCANPAAASCLPRPCLQGIPIGAAAVAAAYGAPTVGAPGGGAAAAPGAAPAEQPLGVPVKSLLQKRLRVLVGGEWKAGQVVGYNHG